MRIRILVLAALVIASFAVLAFADDPFYLYQRGAFGASGNISLESETAYGNRETMLLGADVVEQGIRVRISGTDWLSFEGWGGTAFHTTNNTETGARSRDTAASGDVYARLLNQDGQYVNLSLGLGYLYDYDQTSIPRVRVTISRSWRDLDVTFGTVAELPIKKTASEAARDSDADSDDEHDPVDLIFSAACSYGITDWARVGVESVLEDAEGFWERDEAEGGAKMILGPTAFFSVYDNLYLRFNAGSVIALTSNTPTVGTTTTAPNRVGFLGRMAVGYTFR